MLLWLRDAFLSLCPLNLRILLLFLEAFNFRHHVLRAIPDYGNLPVDVNQCCVEGLKFDADSALVCIPLSFDFVQHAFIFAFNGA